MEKIKKVKIVRPSETEKKLDRALFIAELKKSGSISSTKRKKDNINVKLFKGITRHIISDSIFKCKFYLRNLTDVDYRHMKTFDINSTKISKGVDAMVKNIYAFTYKKAAVTSKGNVYKDVYQNTIPTIKCDIQVYGKLFTDVDIFIHNYINWENSIIIDSKEKVYDLLFTMIFRLDYEIFKLQTAPNIEIPINIHKCTQIS